MTEINVVGRIEWGGLDMRKRVYGTDGIAPTLDTCQGGKKHVKILKSEGEGMRTLKINDLFCGAGGMGIGFKQAGFETAGAWDFDKYAVQAYAHNVDSVVKELSILDMNWDDMPQADVWTFGFPCQDLSIAGKQAGLFEGKRSGLFFEVMRLLDETVENDINRLPDVIMAENVKGLKPYLEVLKEEYQKRGYKTYYTLYNTKFWGLAQNRERYFVVGVHESINLEFEFPIQQEKYIPRLNTFLDSEVDEKYYIDDLKAAKIIERAKEKIYSSKNVVALTETRTDEAKMIRRESMKNGKDFSPRREKVLVPRKDDIANCCTATVGKEQLLLEKLQNVFTDKTGVAFCCDANYHKGTSPGDVGKGRRTHVIEQIQKESGLLDPNNIGRCLRVGGKGSLSAKHNYEHLVTNDLRVRKLTPREYLRLQGFPEDFEIVVSDSQTYKQAGNAVSVPVAKAIAERIRMFLLSL